MRILQGELRSNVFNKPGGSCARQGIQWADLADWACSLSCSCQQLLILPPAALMDWDRQPIKPLWLPDSLVPIGNVLFFVFLPVTYFWFGGHFPASVNFLNVLYILFTEKTVMAQMELELAMCY